jgi:hypothetical protein
MIKPWRLSNSSPSFTPNCQDEVQDLTGDSTYSESEVSEIEGFSLDQSPMQVYANPVEKPSRVLKPIIFNDSIVSNDVFSVVN